MNYTELKDLALAYIDRANDTELTTSRIDLMLKLVESKINRVLNLQSMQVKATVACIPDSYSYPLPTDWLSFRSVAKKIAGSASGLVFNPVSIEQVETARTYKFDGLFAVHDEQLHISKPLDVADTLEFRYTARVSPLSSTNLNNAIATYNPDCYLYGLLVELSYFAKDYTAASEWTSRFEQAVAQMEAWNNEATWSGQVLQVRTY